MRQEKLMYQSVQVQNLLVLYEQIRLVVVATVEGANNNSSTVLNRRVIRPIGQKDPVISFSSIL